MSSTDELPAILGGQPVRPQGRPEWPIPDDDVSQALLASYRDGSWGTYQGGNVERLENQLARYHSLEFVATCGSGTFAVELALRALKVGPGDEVVLAAYDYVGNFLNVHAVGATPVLVDIDPSNWNLTTERLQAALSPKTRAVIVSHLHGGIVPMREVMEMQPKCRVPRFKDERLGPGATWAS
jgi:dTDP-4-amino-4,6-dideoxygalactose transaminase